MLTLTSLERADRHMLLNAGNDVQRWWRLVYTVLTEICALWTLSRSKFNQKAVAPRALAQKLANCCFVSNTRNFRRYLHL